MSDCRFIAFYLPQFYPIPENDRWWGKGFTEWTNVARAAPLFKGHRQPLLPAELGFYDLRLPETREAQAALAREHGIEAFCYWHYWFAGKRLLERPFQEVLDSGKPDFPFCLGWANHSWSGLWSGGDEARVIQEQTYPGRDDHKRHFNYLLAAFRDPRYVRLAGKPLLVIYKPLQLPDCKAVLDYWRDLADLAGLPGLHVVATLEYHERNWPALEHGFDAVSVWTLGRVLQEAAPCLARARLEQALKRRGFSRLHRFAGRLCPDLDRVYDYGAVRDLLLCPGELPAPQHPIAIPNWDTTARYGRRAIILHGSTPARFRLHLRDVMARASAHPPEERIVFLKSWNEWAEGNFLEPDQRFGRGYIEAVRDELRADDSTAGPQAAASRAGFDLTAP